jgi:hypothetical protein
MRTVLPSSDAFDSFSVTNLSIVYSPILMSELWINPFVMVRLLKSPSDYAQMALNATSIFFTSIDKLNHVSIFCIRRGKEKIKASIQFGTC